MDDVIRRRALVHGSVQGVGFRFSTEGEADRLDGTVEVEVEGRPDRVALLLEWLREGPRGARVDRVDVSEVEPVGESAFETRR